MFLSSVFFVLGLVGSTPSELAVLKTASELGGLVFNCTVDEAPDLATGHGMCVTGLSNVDLEELEEALDDSEQRECAMYGEIEGSKFCPTAEESGAF